MLEDNNKAQEAYDCYIRVYTKLRTAEGLSGKERLRSVAVAYKLGELANTYQRPAEEEEAWLQSAVEGMLRILRDEQNASRPRTADGVSDDEYRLILSDLELPRWVEITDVVAPLQALGAFYNRVGNQECVLFDFIAAADHSSARRVPSETKLTRRFSDMRSHSIFLH